MLLGLRMLCHLERIVALRIGKFDPFLRRFELETECLELENEGLSPQTARVEVTENPPLGESLALAAT